MTDGMWVGFVTGAGSTLAAWIVTSGIGSLAKWREERRKRAALLYNLAHEAVCVFERVVQYCGQIKDESGISHSRLYLMFGPESVQKLIELDADKEVLEALYNVRALSDVVNLQIDRTHARFDGSGEVADGVAGHMRLNNTYMIYGSIAAFVRDEYQKIESSIRRLLDVAAAGNGSAVQALQNRFRAAREKYQKVEIKEPPKRPEINPVPKPVPVVASDVIPPRPVPQVPPHHGAN